MCHIIADRCITLIPFTLCNAKQHEAPTERSCLTVLPWKQRLFFLSKASFGNNSHYFDQLTQQGCLERFCCTTIFTVLIRTHLIKWLNRILYWWGKIWCVIVLHPWAEQAAGSHQSLRHLFFILVVCSLFHDVVCVIMHVYWLLSMWNM